jgi:hypothetical protein
MSTTALPDYELVDAESYPGSWILVRFADDPDGGIVVGRIWPGSVPNQWIGQASAGCGDRQHYVRFGPEAAAGAVILQWLDAGQPDARKAAEAAAERLS